MGPQLRERAALRPLSPYAVSKVGQDLMGFQDFQSYRSPIMRTRTNSSNRKRKPRESWGTGPEVPPILESALREIPATCPTRSASGLRCRRESAPLGVALRSAIHQPRAIRLTWSSM